MLLPFVLRKFLGLLGLFSLGSVSLLFFCFFSVGLWFLRAGFWLVRFLGLVLIWIFSSSIVGAGNFVSFNWVRIAFILMFVCVG